MVYLSDSCGRYFEHNSKKYYAEGVDPDEPDAPGRPEEVVEKEREAPRLAVEEEEKKRREKRLQKAREKAAAKQKLRMQLGLEEEEPERDSADETEQRQSDSGQQEGKEETVRSEPVIHGGWSPDWSLSLSLCVCVCVCLSL